MDTSATTETIVTRGNTVHLDPSLLAARPLTLVIIPQTPGPITLNLVLSTPSHPDSRTVLVEASPPGETGREGLVFEPARDISTVTAGLSDSETEPETEPEEVREHFQRCKRLRENPQATPSPSKSPWWKSGPSKGRRIRCSGCITSHEPPPNPTHLAIRSLMTPSRSCRPKLGNGTISPVIKHESP
ncbi:hypothetical protein JAAARDRAFT_198891 [Jaapia argillacea MUCL 33604]|uniref:Uncharacterized protein n=1 Tax=Jaapia argillacea MUCL 33604 TaxID=933084 RepID=A0A067P9L3_9AGAM|nr:hypothetical protein JAAARDRAFT_198891 [Jaapia argillacea MUCL 33604]